MGFEIFNLIPHPPGEKGARKAAWRDAGASKGYFIGYFTWQPKKLLYHSPSSASTAGMFLQVQTRPKGANAVKR